MKIRVADYLASRLVEEGIVDCFSVTGGGAMHLNDAFGHRKGLRVTYNHHEQACAIAAESYARLTQRIAAVCVTSGPGGTNALTGVLGGWLDSIPMLVFSGQVKYSTTIASTDLPLRQLGDQEYNIVDSVRPMTKYCAMVTDVDRIAYHFEKALYIATHGRPGPCWLDIPLNVQAAIVDTDSLLHFDPDHDDFGSGCGPLRLQERVQCVEDAAVDEVFAAIQAAKAPVILAGGGIRTAKAYESFLEAIDCMGIPVCTAWNAHDLLPDEHPLYAGRPGTVGTRGGNFVLQNADLLISLACRMNIRQISYNWENFAPNAYKIAVDIDAAELAKPTVAIDMPIHADVRDFLDAVIRSGKQIAPREHAAWLEWCKGVNDRFPATLPAVNSSGSPLNPYGFIDVLSSHVPNDWSIVASNGSACVIGFQAWRVKSGQRLYTNSGCASMGYGLPAALGAAIARHGDPVLCLEGDGSLMMNLQELETVAYNRLNVKLVIINNDGYHSIRQTQTNTFDAHFTGVDEQSGVGFPRWEAIARAFDLPFYRIGDGDELTDTIDGFLASEGPAVLEAVVDTGQFFEPKLGSKRLPDGSMVSPSLEDMSPFIPDDEMRAVKASLAEALGE
ncbi:thiamine pyrophosphate-binding protein [Enorma phocaeensis]|uniref:Thiamine pyrophosphate-binding protein n=1 Tax=Enorma phocaeensis TaxID=1871019 RepID=A0A921LT26_9ACTN|nr:thiamine pyrophosphate-binding protein [Enorma phocaeensis]